MEPLSDEQINQALPNLNLAWSAIPGEGLVRVWSTNGIAQGAALGLKLAEIAATYQSAPVILITHDTLQMALAAKGQPGLTAREIALAEAIDNLRLDGQ